MQEQLESCYKHDNVGISYATTERIDRKSLSLNPALIVF